MIYIDPAQEAMDSVQTHWTLSPKACARKHSPSAALVTGLVLRSGSSVSIGSEDRVAVHAGAVSRGPTTIAYLGGNPVVGIGRRRSIQ